MPYSPEEMQRFFTRVEQQNTPTGAPQPALATDALYDQTQPVQARELFTVKPQTQPQEDANTSFFELPSMDLDPELAPQYEPDKKQFYQSFARGFNSRRFTGLKDYENWLRSLPGESQQIRAYMQEIGEKYMPTAAKQEWEARQADKVGQQRIKTMAKQMKTMQSEIEAQGLDYDVALDAQGRVSLKSKEAGGLANQKAKDARLKNAMTMREKAGSPQERSYYQNQIDTLMSEDGGSTGASDKPQAVSRETFIQGFTAKKGYAPSEAMIQGMIARGFVK